MSLRPLRPVDLRIHWAPSGPALGGGGGTRGGHGARWQRRGRHARCAAPRRWGAARAAVPALGQQSVADLTRETERHVERIECHVERFAPGFRDRILARHVQSPDDMQRRNANLVHGHVGAGSYMLDQMVFRPVPRLSPYRTPVRGLYLGSAATFPGGSVHGAPGHAAARAALAEERLRRFVSVPRVRG